MQKTDMLYNNTQIHNNTQIQNQALNFIRTYNYYSLFCDVIFLILLSKNPVFTVPNGYPHLMVHVTFCEFVARRRVFYSLNSCVSTNLLLNVQNSVSQLAMSPFSSLSSLIIPSSLQLVLAVFFSYLYLFLFIYISFKVLLQLSIQQYIVLELINRTVSKDKS